MSPSIRSLTRALLEPPLDAPRATILIRVLVGSVFLWEGTMKFVFPATQGVGRFTRIGIPAPEWMAPFVGIVEIAGGMLLLAGLLTRLAAIPLMFDMCVAIASTKIPLLLGVSRLPAPPVEPKSGFWATLHEIRSDEAQLLGCTFLLIVGPGAWAVDAWLVRRRAESEQFASGAFVVASARR